MSDVEYVVGDPALPALGDMSKFATLVAAYHKALIAAGVSEPLANTLVMNYHDRMMQMVTTRHKEQPAPALAEADAEQPTTKPVDCDFCQTTPKRRAVHLVKRRDEKLAYACEVHATDVLNNGGRILSSLENDK